MTHHEAQPTAIESVLELLSEHGLGAMAEAMQTLLNEAMQLERSEFLRAAPGEGTDERTGYANGFKEKTLRTRVGELALRVPQARPLPGGEPLGFYPKSLERGLRSERALKLAIAEMYVQGVTRDPPRIGPHMMPYGPHVGQAIWKLYVAIDWTHQHHDQTYDSLMSRDVPWSEKERWKRRSVERYLARRASLPRSPAPLDVTMRRAAVMGKPYFTLFRNRYPLSNNYFFVAHWWHPVIYEAVMIAGNDEEQEQAVRETHALTEEVLRDRPQRMLLAREVMPRYARFSPESANVFDNLHMLHGIAYDILAYEGWSMNEKRRELERVIEAMSYQRGDEALARKFALPYPEMEPRVYADWMKPVKGEMSRIMEEMLEEMWPGMSPDGSSVPPLEVVDQFRKKMTPGMQPGEHAGSLMQALGEVAPGMRHDPASMKPGEAAPEMVATMLDGWRRRHGSRPDVAPLPMEEDPALPPVGAQHATVTEGQP